MKTDYRLQTTIKNGELIIKTSDILKQFGVDDTISSLLHGGEKKTVNPKYADIEKSMRERGLVGGAFYFNIVEFTTFMNRYEPQKENQAEFKRFKKWATNYLHLKVKEADMQRQLHFEEDMLTKTEALKFAEFTGLYYVRLHKVWVHRYANQSEKENWRTTEQVYEEYLENKEIFGA